MTTERSKRQPIQAAQEKCAGCQICQLRCSLRFFGMPDPSRAYIRVVRSTEHIGSDISFTEKCDSCGICVAFCPYGTLSRLEKGANNDGRD